MEMADICHRVNSAVGRWATPISAAWLAARVLEGAAARYWKWHGGASWTQGWPRRAEAPRRASRLAPRRRGAPRASRLGPKGAPRQFGSSTSPSRDKKVIDAAVEPAPTEQKIAVTICSNHCTKRGFQTWRLGN